MTQQVFNDRYRVEGELGRGAMGVVYRGYDLLLQRNVAIKMLSQSSLDPDQRATLIQEAQSNAQLQHANIAAVYDVIDSDGLAYIVMEYVDGPTLREKVPAGRKQVLAVAEKLASALQHAHTHGIVHRDLKPENVIWAGEEQVKLTDFGLARGIDAQHSVEGALTGTVQYMAPEQVRGERVDGRADLYALGVMLFEWLTGQSPFPEENAYEALVRKLQEEAPEAAAVASDIPPKMNQVVQKLLARDPEQRYQSAEELLDDLRMGPAHRRASGAGLNNLPVEITSFIGRDRMLSEIDAHIPENRVVTLMGVGGCGKTRLALRAGYRLLERFPDGVWWIELESLDDPELFSQHVASTLKQRVSAGDTPLETLVGYLRDKYLLLILNNCEHLIDPAAQFVDELLHRCPRLTFLTTSREVLGVEGERALLVASLDFPKSGAAYDETELMAFESVRLFCERAAEALPDFQVSSENLEDIARICHQLDGIPLAIELAAARVKALTVKQILGRLEDRFSLLTSGRRTALPRHQTLRATLDWSYDLLAASERHLFDRLAVFSGGWDLEAAENVCAMGETKATEVLDLLTQLTEKSMVLIDRQPSVTPRYRLLESMRQYALEKMIASDQVETLRQRHLDHYLRVARKLIVSSGARATPEMLDRMERDHDNLRSAFEWSLNEAVPLAKKLELAIHLGYFWDVRGYSLEGLDRLGALIQRLDPDQNDLQTANLLEIAASIAYKKSDYITSKAYWERCLEIARSSGLEGQALEAQALMGLANTATEVGDYESPVPLFQKAHDIFELLGDQEGMGEALRNLGWAYMRPGDLERAEPALQASLAIHRRAGNNIAMASTLAGLGELAIRRGQYNQAVPFLEESLALRQAIGVKWGIGVSLGSLGWIALRKNDFQRARTYLGESLKVRRQIDDKGGMAWCLEKLAEMAQAEGRLEEAIVIFGSAAAMRVSIQSVIDPADVPAYEGMQERLKESMGLDAYQAAWERGRGLEMDEFVQVALAEPEGEGRAGR